MAKKFVRCVTGVDDIEKFDKSLTNVNDLISDGQNTYIHTKKGKNEFYYKVTDGVTSVKSTDSTITVEKSDNGTVNLKTNPQKVLDKSTVDNLLAQKQNKLTAGDGLAMVGDTITLKTFDGYRGNLNDLTYTCIAKPADNTPNLPSGVDGNGILSSLRVGDVVIQKYHPFTGNQLYIRSCTGLPGSPKWKDWKLLS